MNGTGQPPEAAGPPGPLAVIHRVTTALGHAAGTAALERVIAAALTSRLGLGFSRAFVLRYDERRECFTLDRAVGRSLRASTPAARKADDPACEKFDGEALWKEVLRRAERDVLTLEGRDELCILPDRELRKCFCARLAIRPGLVVCESPDDLAALPAPLDTTLTVPFVGLSVHTDNGIRLAVLADRAGQAHPAVTREELVLLGWFHEQATLAWSGAEKHDDCERALAELRQLDTLKNSFLATISHELRTPLTAIIGYLELFLNPRREAAPEERHEWIKRSRRQAEHFLGLVNDLIELAENQVEGGRALPVGKVDAHAALAAAIDRLAAGPRHPESRIAAPPRSDEPCYVLTHEAALQRILYHLLENALKFSGSGDTVSVRFQLLGDRWYLVVEDQGIGLERLLLHKVFSLFYQVDSRVCRAYPGMGIGLPLVQILLEATGGHIFVESEPGHGSVFTVSYPLWREPQGTPFPPAGTGG